MCSVYYFFSFAHAMFTNNKIWRINQASIENNKHVAYILFHVTTIYYVCSVYLCILKLSLNSINLFKKRVFKSIIFYNKFV